MTAPASDLLAPAASLSSSGFSDGLGHRVLAFDREEGVMLERLYVRPELAETLEPALTGWQAHARPFAFEPEQDYAEGAWRFLTGTPNVPALYAATAGYDVVEEIGVERIRERSVEQTTLLIELLEEAGFDPGSPRDPERRGGTVVVKTPDFARVNSELAERGILVDCRPETGLRIGPHFYNTDDELRFAVEQIVELSSREARPTAAHT
jgi:kynureninase